MSDSDIPRANFTISEQAKAGIARIRREYDALFPNDPAAVISVAWGIAMTDAGPRFEGVVIGIYPQSQFAEVAHGIQVVSGVPLIFFTTAEYRPKFDGKVLDYTAQAGFFMRLP
jgi:hypothetical protein